MGGRLQPSGSPASSRPVGSLDTLQKLQLIAANAAKMQQIAARHRCGAREEEVTTNAWRPSRRTVLMGSAAAIAAASGVGGVSIAFAQDIARKDTLILDSTLQRIA